jgi:ribosomal-protein-alanine N-acetyltransferase
MIVIATASPAHAAGIHRVETESFSRPWSEQAILAEMENGHSTLLVALDGEQVVGWAGMESVCGEGSVTNIAVLPAFRRQGVGRRLTAALIEQARRQECEFLMLEVRVSNTPAIALYEELGFARIGVRPRFYDDPREDALMMQIQF